VIWLPTAKCSLARRIVLICNRLQRKFSGDLAAVLVVRRDLHRTATINIVAALRSVEGQPSATVLFGRPRHEHLHRHAQRLFGRVTTACALQRLAS
jgi:hypothetical protein